MIEAIYLQPEDVLAPTVPEADEADYVVPHLPATYLEQPFVLSALRFARLLTSRPPVGKGADYTKALGRATRLYGQMKTQMEVAAATVQSRLTEGLYKSEFSELIIEDGITVGSKELDRIVEKVERREEDNSQRPISDIIRGRVIVAEGTSEETITSVLECIRKHFRVPKEVNGRETLGRTGNGRSVKGYKGLPKARLYFVDARGHAQLFEIVVCTQTMLAEDIMSHEQYEVKRSLGRTALEPESPNPAA